MPTQTLTGFWSRIASTRLTRHRTRLAVLTALPAVCLTLLAGGCGDNDPQQKMTGIAPVPPAQVVCVGRVEPVEGEVDVSAQKDGTLEAVVVREGQWVEPGTLLATVDARREKAQLELAKARFSRVKAGHGAEEIAAVVHQREAVDAELVYARQELARAEKLRSEAAISADELESKQKRVAALDRQSQSLVQQAAAMKRGPLPEEIMVAKAEVDAAQATYDLREVRAQSAGAILHLYRHTGDYVSGAWPTPILRMANTNQLQVRIEIGEAETHRVAPGMMGSFTVFGLTNDIGQLTVRTLLPSFGPKRLFDPDGNARVDTRTLQALCDITQARQPVCSGQRVLVRLAVK